MGSRPVHLTGKTYMDRKCDHSYIVRVCGNEMLLTCQIISAFVDAVRRRGQRETYISILRNIARPSSNFTCCAASEQKRGNSFTYVSVCTTEATVCCRCKLKLSKLFVFLYVQVPTS
eukprot:2656808-Pleurochrysis_carterae.AAC.2